MSPRSLDEALALLDRHGSDARVVAGGTDLLVELDRRVSTPSVLIDLTRIEGLDAISEADGTIRLGPLVTHNQAATSPVVVAGGIPLAQACLEVGSPALRNRATIVGNVVTASPANDTISALASLDAVVAIASTRGERTVPIAEFHTGVRATVLEADELVTSISFPALSDDDRGLYLKLGLRKAQAISVVHVSMVCRGASVVADARIAIGSVAPTIVTVPAAEQLLSGVELASLTDGEIDAVAAVCQEAVNPIDDLRAPADYRTDQVEVMVRVGLDALRAGTERVAHPAAPPVLGGPAVSVKPTSAASAAGEVAVELSTGDAVTATINGEPVSAPQHGETLLDWLRDQAGLTGTKEGCAEGECGACTVHLGSTAVLSCLVPAGRADGESITTIEGLAPGDDLHPLQQAFIDRAAVQCGYCIPGFLMAGAALEVESGTALSAEDLKLGLSGNLCRCTGYYAIESAFADAASREAQS